MGTYFLKLFEGRSISEFLFFFGKFSLGVCAIQEINKLFRGARPDRAGPDPTGPEKYEKFQIQKCDEILVLGPSI